MSFTEGDNQSGLNESNRTQLSVLEQDLLGLPQTISDFIATVEYPRAVDELVTSWRNASGKIPQGKFIDTLANWAQLRLTPDEKTALSAETEENVYAYFAQRALDKRRPWTRTIRNIALNTAYGMYPRGVAASFYEFHEENSGIYPDSATTEEAGEVIRQCGSDNRVQQVDAQKLVNQLEKSAKIKKDAERAQALTNVKTSFLIALFEQHNYMKGLEYLSEHPELDGMYLQPLTRSPDIDFVRELEMQKIVHISQDVSSDVFARLTPLLIDDRQVGLTGSYFDYPQHLLPADSLHWGRIVFPYDVMRASEATNFDAIAAMVKLKQLQGKGVLPGVGISGEYIIRDKKGDVGQESVFLHLVFPRDTAFVNSVEETMFARIIGEPAEPVGKVPSTILTGMCLASGTAASVRGESGTLIPITDYRYPITERVVPGSLNVQYKLTLYEEEALLRLAHAVTAISRSASVDTVNVGIPGAEYYHYVLDAYNNGFMDKEDVLHWFNEVDNRQEALEGVMDLILTRYFGFDKAVCDLRYIRPLNVLKEYIRSMVKEGKKPSLQEELALVQEGEYQHIFRELLRQQSNQPRSFQDLNFMSYSAMQFASNKTGFMYLVMDPKEAVMQTRTDENYSDAIKAQRLHRSMVGVYPLEEVLASSKSDSLYHVASFRDSQILGKMEFIMQLGRKYMKYLRE